MKRSKWIFEPSDFFRYVASARGLRADEMRVAPRTVMVFGRRDWEALRRSIRAKSAKLDPTLCLGRAGRHPVSVFRAAIGSPAAAIAVHEMAALGARWILSFGARGSLREDLPIGSLVVPTLAYSDEGTSRHYGGGQWARPDARMLVAIRTALRRRGLSCREGSVWTTDAPYREPRSRARSLAAKGVVGVEMEAAAMYTVGRSCGVRVGSVFVVSDELGGNRWRPGFLDPVFHRGKREGMKIVVDVMSGKLS